MLFVQYDEFLCFRGVVAAVRADAYALEVQPGIQSATFVGSEIPVKGVCLVGRYTVFRVCPQVTSRGVKEFELDIHLTAYAIVNDAEGSAGLRRIRRALYTDNLWFQTLCYIERQLSR